MDDPEDTTPTLFRWLALKGFNDYTDLFKDLMGASMDETGDLVLEFPQFRIIAQWKADWEAQSLWSPESQDA